MAMTPFTGAQRLRQLLADKNNIVMCPGVYDGLTARIAAASGPQALYMTGAGTSVSRLGWPDLGMATFDDMSRNAAMIASLDPALPLIADADTGYGGPVMVQRTVAAYARAGVAACHIEDQVQEKRCGHLLGKQIVDREVYYSRLRAAVAARNQLGSDMVIIARTDSRQSYGFDEAYERLKEAVKIGVDVVFLEALQSREECRKICELMGDFPVLLNIVPGGVTPVLTKDEALEMGFRIMLFPGICIGPVIAGVTKELQHLQAHGKPADPDASGKVHEAFKLCGLEECVRIDKEAGGQAYHAV